MESATTFCRMRGNAYVEIGHWLWQILQEPDSDILRIIRHFGLNESALARDLTGHIDRLPKSSDGTFDISSKMEEMLEETWMYTTLKFGESVIRTGHVFYAGMATRGLSQHFLDISGQFAAVRTDVLSAHFEDILGDSPERTDSAFGVGAAPVEGAGSALGRGGVQGSGEALAKYSIDLTDKAREGGLDPVVGRDSEIRKLVDILLRRRQNNPLLAGEAGVGKTAIVEGLALRVVAGDVPPPLLGVRIKTLDIGLLQAGASMKGEFENRLRQVIQDVEASAEPVILFVDEAHTLIGAGGAAGTGDAANLLKPALARGSLRTIAATTWAEYKKHIEKDPALTRRFHVVKVEEPNEADATEMMRHLAATLEKHHNVLIFDEALVAAVALSVRYIPSRQLPDKSISLLDTACARVAVSQHATPASLEENRRRTNALRTELEILRREAAMGMEVADRLRACEGALGDLEAERSVLDARWEREKGIVEQIFAVRATLREAVINPDAPEEGAGAGAGDSAGLSETLKRLTADLRTVQGDDPLVLPTVDEQAVAAVVSDWTGVPVGRMVRDELAVVLELGSHLSKRVIGQDDALAMIARRVETARAGMDNPSRPVGVFMLCGPSGVGKTETALALAETLYGGEHNLVTINMSEFQEAHTVSTLKGAPPGYVGYGEGGVLTEAVRRRPHSVVLLDEVEKAHPDVHEIFFQVFDKGVMEDGEGRAIDFRNTLILLTSNVGSDLVMSLCEDDETAPEPEGLATALRPELLKVFPAALLGRLVVVPYYPLSDGMLRSVTRLQLDRIVQRLQGVHAVPMVYDDAVVDLVVARCKEVESGGRMIDAILTNTLLPSISRTLLLKAMDREQLERVHVGVKEGQFTYTFGPVSDRTPEPDAAPGVGE